MIAGESLRNSRQHPARVCSVEEESKFGNAARQTRRGMTFRNVASNGGFVSRLGAPRRDEGARNFRSISPRRRGPRERRRKFALSHRTTQSIHHSCCSFRGDESARYTREGGAVENLTSETPVKLAANNLYWNNAHKSEPGLESMEPKRVSERKHREKHNKEDTEQPSGLINRSREIIRMGERLFAIKLRVPMRSAC